MSQPLSPVSSLKASVAKTKANKGKKLKDKENQQPEADKKKKISVEYVDPLHLMRPPPNEGLPDGPKKRTTI
jgi:hypothetical protein